MGKYKNLNDVLRILDNPDSTMSKDYKNLNNALQTLDKKMIKEMSRQLQDLKKLMAYSKCAIMEVETKLNVLNEEFSMLRDRNPIEAIKTRLKSPDSIRDKLNRKGLPMTIDAMETNINDIAGIRVICSFVEDVYLIADALLSQDDIKLIQEKDYIASPKQNGYRSLHLIVEVPIFLAEEKRPMKVEIQLRTIAMDCWASLEHKLKYKKDFVYTEEMARELFECAVISARLDAKMETIRKKIEEDLTVTKK